MNLELEIEKGGQSNQLAENLKESTSNFGKGLLENAGMGIGDVIASTGINAGVGSTDDIIADNISAIVNLTGEQGLTNLVNNLEGYTQQLTSMGLNAPEDLVNIILDEIKKVLIENGVIDTIKTGMQVTQGTIELAKGGLTYANSIATIVGNIQKLLLVLNKTQNADVMCTPTVKDSLSFLTASLINIIQSQYSALKQQLIIFYNSMICSSNDAVLDNIVVSVNNILEVIEPALDPVMQKYTGHTLQEIRNICNQGFAYVGMIQRSAANKRKQKDEEQSAKVQEKSIEENSKKKLSKEERREQSKKKWEQKTKDLSAEQAKEKLMNWMNNQSIMIQNAFHMLIIKDTIEDIKTFISQLQNTSIENQMDLLNTINNVLEIFEQIGLTPDAKGITIDDLKALGLAAAGTAVETATNIGNQVQNKSQQYIDQTIGEANANISANGQQVLSQNIIANAKGTVAGVTETAKTIAENNPGKSQKEYAQNIATVVGQNMIVSGIDQTINTAIDAELNMDINSIINVSSNITNNLKPFTYTQSNENKNININVTINKNPSLHLTSISSFIKSFKSGKKDIFNNGATKQIKDAFKEAWETNEKVELKIQAIVDGVTKFYIFTFEVNQDARKNPEKYGDDILEDTNDLNNLGSDSKNKAISMLNNAENELSNTKDQAISQLTKVNVNINADMIESVLYDPSIGKMKVLMFDEVIQFLKILQPVVEILKVIAHILENYMINKEFVRTKQHADLANALKKAAQLVNGLEGVLNLDNTNFFIIRTKETAKWALNTFNEQPDKSGFITIGILQTTILNTYCATHNINPDYPLNLLLGTTLYFDEWAIEHGGYKDGTSIGIDNIEINRDLGEVYYDKQNRSAISSEILRARKKNVDPKYVDVPEEILKDDNIDIKSILNAITLNSDEIEGQQTLSIGDLDLCSPTIKDRNKNKNNSNNNDQKLNKENKNAVIIEFGDEYTLGNRVEYQLAVKPGQTLIEGDIIGYIKNDEKLIPIRTQYTGTIRSIDESDSDYEHLYPSAATRHIIIDNPQKCSASDYNINDVISLQQKFKKATELEALIINCMPLSILPSLLINADRTSEISTSYTSYNEIIKNYDSSIIDFAEKLQKSGNNFKSNTQTSSKPIVEKYNNKKIINISRESVDKIKDDMLNDRKLMVEKAIEVYNESIDKSKKKVNGDNMYLDCIGLAYSDKEDFERSNKDGDTLKYNNYYINLLKSIPPSSKQQSQNINVNMSDIQGEIDKMHLSDVSIQAGYHANMDSSIFSASNLISSLNNTKIGEDEEPGKIDEFKQIISDIIDIRLAYEKQSNASMISVFNSYYRKNIKDIDDPYNDLKQRIEQEGIDKNDSDSILKQIKLDKNYIDATFNNDNRQDFDNKKNEVCQQALTLFMYLSNANITKSKSTKKYGALKLSDTIKGIEELYINDIKKITYNNKEYTNFGDLYDDVYAKEIEDNANKEGITEWTIKNNTINNVLNLLKTKTPKLNRTIIDKLVEAHLNGEKNLSDSTKEFFENVAENNLYYQMLKDESKKIEDFWQEVIAEYYGSNNLDNAINAITDYANGMNKNAKWPQSISFNVNNTNYELYTFLNPFKTPKEIPNDIPFADLEMNNLENELSGDPVIDLTDTKDIRENDPITIFDYEYWVVYMLNATLFTLIPMYWADGFDIPPFMTPLRLPAIYFPIAPPVMIPIVNVLMVFGIALRGMWPAPIILMINLSSDDIDVMIIVKIVMEIVKDVFKQMQNLVENTIPMVVNEMLMGYLDENEIAQKAIEKFRTYSSIIKSIPVKDKALLDKKFNEALQDELNKQTQLNNTNAKLQQKQNDITDANRETQQKVNQKINELNNKRNDYVKKYDKRQVITRESDLGDGPTPM